MATDSPSVAFLSSINDLAAGLERKYVEKYEEQKIVISRLQQEIDELRNYDQIDNILDEIEQTEQKYDDDDIQTNNNNAMLNNDDDQAESDDDDDDDNRERKTSQFWNQLTEKLEEGDLEYIKDLVRKNQLSMDEKHNQNGRTLLMLATYYGSYDLVSMCINLGADIDVGILLHVCYECGITKNNIYIHRKRMQQKRLRLRLQRSVDFQILRNY